MMSLWTNKNSNTRVYSILWFLVTLADEFLGFGPGVNSKSSPLHGSGSPPSRRSNSPDHPNPAETITEAPSQSMGRIGWALRTLLLSTNSCLRDRKVSGRLVRRCAPGTELVDWLLQLSTSIHTRAQAAGMWQALLEEGVVSHGELNEVY